MAPDGRKRSEAKRLHLDNVRQTHEYNKPVSVSSSFIHAWETPSGMIQERIFDSPAPRWVAMRETSPLKRDVTFSRLTGVWLCEVHDTHALALNHLEVNRLLDEVLFNSDDNYQPRQMFLVPTTVVRQITVTSEPITYYFPERIEVK